MEKLFKLFDYGMHKPYLTLADITKACEEAITHSRYIASISVNPCHVDHVAKLLKGTDIRVCTVIGFPLGSTISEVKAFEAEAAIRDGADEVDVVMNISALKSGDWNRVRKDLEMVVRAAKRVRSNVIVKAIIETPYLTDDEKVRACQIAKVAGVDFVKTSTGFANPTDGIARGATVHDVQLMKRVVGELGVKAAGGIRSLQDVLALVRAGADRIGSSSAISIIREVEKAS